MTGPIRARWAEWFLDHDVLLCPVMPMAAIPHNHEGALNQRTVVINGAPRTHLEALAWPGLVGVSYLPSTVVPVGRTRAGLPVGIQIVGRISRIAPPWPSPPISKPCSGGTNRHRWPGRPATGLQKMKDMGKGAHALEKQPRRDGLTPAII